MKTTGRETDGLRNEDSKSEEDNQERDVQEKIGFLESADKRPDASFMARVFGKRGSGFSRLPACGAEEAYAFLLIFHFFLDNN
jgi:hypothetical protein